MTREDFGPASRPSGQAAIQSRLDAVAGPWVHAELHDPVSYHVRSTDGSVVADAQCAADADLISHAPADIVALLAEVDRLTAALLRCNSSFEEYERRYYLQEMANEDLRATATPSSSDRAESSMTLLDDVLAAAADMLRANGFAVSESAATDTGTGAAQGHIPTLTEIPRTQIMERGYQFRIACSCGSPGEGRYTRVSAEDSHRRHVAERQSEAAAGGHRG